MPVISRFYGIIVRLLHLPDRGPTLYANYGDQELMIDPQSLEMVSGNAPQRVAALVREWAAEHRDELVDLLARPGHPIPPSSIEPLV